MALEQLKQNIKLYEYVCANLLPFFNSTPILVYQMGRGGSTALRNSLIRCPAPETALVFHLHGFTAVRKLDAAQLALDEPYRTYIRAERQHAQEVYAGFPLKQKLNWFLRERVYASSLYRNSIRNHRHAKIITLVREPIGTNISMFFMVLARYLKTKYENSQSTTGQLIDIFLTKYNCTRPLTWFDAEMKPATGIDVYQHPFPAEKGYTLIHAGNLELLVIKAELDDALKAPVIADFVGLANFELMRSNVSAEKKYARQYREFKEQLRLSPAFVEQMYNSKFATHFYSAAELNKLRTYWLARAT